MENVRRYRALGQLCRQQAVFHPEARLNRISEALRREHLAETEIAMLFREPCARSDGHDGASGGGRLKSGGLLRI